MPADLLTAAALFQFTPLLVACAWTAFGMLNFWVWRRAKTAGHLVMVIASGWLAIDSLMQTLCVSILGPESGSWASAIGVALMTGGFYVTVQPIVSPELQRLFGRRPPIPKGLTPPHFPSPRG